MKIPVRFNAVLQIVAKEVSASFSTRIDDLVIVRDVFGRPRIVFDDRKRNFPKPAIEKFSRRLHSLLGPYSPGVSAIALPASSLFAPKEIFESKYKSKVRILGKQKTIGLVERTVSNQDWFASTPVAETPQKPTRLTMFGIKGGVGRSTALSVIARDLARRGIKVLIIDLDLESPGVGSTLLPAAATPKYGVVDWLVESNVAPADAELRDNLVGRSPIGAGMPGEILIAPAVGADSRGFVEKLSRAYMAKDHRTLSENISMLIDTLERQEKPSVTIIDSRAGIHDISAIALTQLRSFSLLFAAHSPQTWSAYRMLFQHLEANPSIGKRFREGCKMVAAMVPETARETHLNSFRDCSQRLFQDSLYEPASATDLYAFNFDVDDTSAPHYPLANFWSRSFQEFDPLNDPGCLEEKQINSAYSEIIDYVNQLLT